jgi:hypothetical protein
MKKVHLEAVDLLKNRETDLSGMISSDGEIVYFYKDELSLFIETLNSKRLYVVWNETGKEVNSRERLPSTNR